MGKRIRVEIDLADGTSVPSTGKRTEPPSSVGHSGHGPARAGGLVKIQMQDQGKWCDLGGVYTPDEANDAIGKFMVAVTHKQGTSRAFRTRDIAR